MRTFSYILRILIGIVAMAQISGCTLMGLGIGAAASKGDQTLYGWQREGLKTGDNIEVHMLDSTVVSGTYAGYRFQSLDTYAERYALWREQQEQKRMIPRVNESITVVQGSGASDTHSFAGIDTHASASDTEYVIYLQQENGAFMATPVRDLVSLRTADTMPCGGEEFLLLLQENNAPLRTVPLLSHGTRSNEAHAYIDVGQVDRVRVKGKNYRSTGLIVGALLDTAAIIAALGIRNSLDEAFDDWEWDWDPEE